MEQRGAQRDPLVGEGVIRGEIRNRKTIFNAKDIGCPDKICDIIS